MKSRVIGFVVGTMIMAGLWHLVYADSDLLVYYEGMTLPQCDTDAVKEFPEKWPCAAKDKDGEFHMFVDGKHITHLGDEKPESPQTSWDISEGSLLPQCDTDAVKEFPDGYPCMGEDGIIHGVINEDLLFDSSGMDIKITDLPSCEDETVRLLREIRDLLKEKSPK